MGRTFGDFRVRAKLGAGGFGAVYLAHQPQLDREAVIKVLHGRGVGSSDAFLREARLASQIDHPFAAHIYAFGAEPDGVRWIAMELVRGVPLDRLIASQGPIPLHRFVNLFERLCEVVDAAHERGIIHRDIKPANVIVMTRSGRMLPKLLDLGIAGLADDVAAPSGADARPLLGSPPYMPPEQWVDGNRVDARSDLYALGVLCFEALTGRRPFTGKTLFALARAHATKPIPRLGGAFAPAVDAVIARALAKKPADRFASALELAAALRAASGAELEVEHVPRLADELRDTLIAQAPQPIAEAASALDVARTAEHAAGAARQLAAVVIRYLGVLALGCRARTGADDDGAAAPLLAKLRAASLTDRQWVALTTALCTPFAARADYYPIPELVAFATGDAPAIAALVDAADTGELDALAGALRSAPFLLAYPLAVPVAGYRELWMGARRRQLATAATADGHPLIVDGDGAPVIALWPIAQALSPTPGAPRELFMLDGNGRHGAKLVAMPVGFERHDPELWAACAPGLFPALDDGAAASARGEDAPPYRGLATFRPDDAALFFGREREVEAFANRLRLQSLIAVVGPSGAGKSSFVQAGVIPSLPGNWRAIVVRPGASPIAALAARLTTDRAAADALRTAIAASPGALAAHLRASGTPTILVIDQLEEVLTLCADPLEQARYAEALATAAGDIAGPVRVVLTLRDDFLMRLGQLPALHGRIAQGLELLGTPSRADLLRIVTEPAARRGYELDDGLPAEMVDAVVDQPGALPLLSFTSAMLWEVRDRSFKRLTAAAYRALGGVGGALAQHAERVLLELPADLQPLVRETFRHLVTAQGTRATMTRRDMQQVLRRGAADQVLERLIAARLLVASETDGGEDRIEVIHETLLASWPRLVSWQREDAESVRVRDQVRAAARQWTERGRPRGLLWRGEPLTELRLWRARYAGQLTHDEDAFATASLRDDARGRRWRRAAIAAVVAGLTIGLVVLFALNAKAHDRLVALYQEEGRQAVVTGDAAHGLVYLDQAYQRGARGPALATLLAAATRAFDGQLQSFGPHPDRALTAVFAPDGKTIATGGGHGVVRVWDAASGRRLRDLVGHTGEVWNVRFSPDGSQLLSASWDHTAKVWDLASGALRFTLAHDGNINAAVFSPDGRRILTAGEDKLAKVWDATSGQLVATLAGHTDGLRAAQWSHDGRRIATAGRDQTVRLWDASSGAALHVLAGHTAEVWRLEFSPDDSRLVSGSVDATAKVWDAASGAPITSFDQHTGIITSVAFSPDGARVLTASADGSAKVWATDTGKLAFNLAHGGPVNGAAFDPAGARIVTVGDSGVVRLWESERGAAVWTFLGHLEIVYSARFSPDGGELVTASFDGSAKLWNARATAYRAAIARPGAVNFVAYRGDGAQILAADDQANIAVIDAATARVIASRKLEDAQTFATWSPDGRRFVTGSAPDATIWDAATLAPVLTLHGHDATVSFASFSPDGTRVVTASEDQTAAVWDARTGVRLATLRGHGAAVWCARFDPSGTRIVTTSDDRTAKIWDARSGELLHTLTGHTLALDGAVFSPDGTRVVTTSDDRTVRIWNTATGAQRVMLEGHTSAVQAAAFTPDGAIVVTASLDGTARAWDATTGAQLGVVGTHADGVTTVDVSPTAAELVTGGVDHAVRVWPLVRDTRSPAAISAYVRCSIPFRLEGDQVRRVELPATGCR